eukprot:6188657-Pleurochrysis_carterae.AAC.2
MQDSWLRELLNGLIYGCCTRPARAPLERNSAVTPEACTNPAYVQTIYGDLSSSPHIAWGCSVWMKGVDIQTHHGRVRARG